jgi:beta-glucosidase
VAGGGTANGTLVDLFTCNGSAAQVWTPGASGSLVNKGSGTCLDDTGMSTTPGTQVQIWSCGGGANQSWVSPAGGGSSPTGATGPVVGLAGLCLDVRSASTADGTPVQVYTCNSTNAQNWTVEANGTLQALGKCLDVAGGGTANGTLVELFTCNGTGAQQWQPGASQSLVNPQSGKCLDDTNMSTTPGTQSQIWSCTGAANQSWALP